MFTSISHSLCLVPVLSVVCWRAHVLFTLIVCVCVCVHSGVQHILHLSTNTGNIIMFG
jgi:hypothetical protein